MKTYFSIDVPKIEVVGKELFSVYGENREQLFFGENKNVGGQIPLFFRRNGKVDETKPVAYMSYKKIGQKLVKKVSYIDGVDFFFKYDKANGFFDKKKGLISQSGNEYSIYNINKKKFYSELIDVLKLRLLLGYIGSDDKRQSADFYFREAHKYVIMNKFDLRLDECMNFLNGILEKSYIPENFEGGFLSELHKSIFENELSRAESLDVEYKAKLSLINEGKGKKFAFDDKNLYKKVLDEIRTKETERRMNMVKLREAMFEKMR